MGGVEQLGSVRFLLCTAAHECPLRLNCKYSIITNLYTNFCKCKYLVGIAGSMSNRWFANCNRGKFTLQHDSKFFKTSQVVPKIWDPKDGGTKLFKMSTVPKQHDTTTNRLNN